MPLDVSHLPPALHPYLWGGTAAMVAEASTFPIGNQRRLCRLFLEQTISVIKEFVPHLSYRGFFFQTQQRQDYNYKVARGIADSQEQSKNSFLRITHCASIVTSFLVSFVTSFFVSFVTFFPRILCHILPCILCDLFPGIPALSRASNVSRERKERVNFTEGFPQLCLDRLFMEASSKSI